jgi:death-on-curing protein
VSSDLKPKRSRRASAGGIDEGSELVYVERRGGIVRIYLTEQTIIGLHAAIFGCTVEQARHRLRSEPSLEGAVNRPHWYAGYGDADIALEAAVLAHGIAETQPFIDGNKRTALSAMLVFLELNGYLLDASQEERAHWMLDLGNGLDERALADRIRTKLVSLWEE